MIHSLLLAIGLLSGHVAYAADDPTPFDLSKCDKIYLRLGQAEEEASTIASIRRSNQFSHSLRQSMGRSETATEALSSEMLAETELLLQRGDFSDLSRIWGKVFLDVESSHFQANLAEKELLELKNALKDLPSTATVERKKIAATIQKLEAKIFEADRTLGSNFEIYAKGRKYLEVTAAGKNPECNDTACIRNAQQILRNIGAYDQSRHSTSNLLPSERPKWDIDRPENIPKDADPTKPWNLKYADGNTVRGRYYRSIEAQKAAAVTERFLAERDRLLSFATNPLFLKFAERKANKMLQSSEAKKEWDSALKVFYDVEARKKDMPAIMRLSLLDTKDKMVDVLLEERTRNPNILVTFARTLEKQKLWQSLKAHISESKNEALLADFNDAEKKAQILGPMTVTDEGSWVRATASIITVGAYVGIATVVSKYLPQVDTFLDRARSAMDAFEKEQTTQKQNPPEPEQQKAPEQGTTP
ncbi:hypothetical protein K2X30_14265 [bacterium]|jgi:hypothetical protein|nr:hypothetical protein [bacterium]